MPLRELSYHTFNLITCVRHISLIIQIDVPPGDRFDLAQSQASAHHGVGKRALAGSGIESVAHPTAPLEYVSDVVGRRTVVLVPRHEKRLDPAQVGK